MSNRAFRHAAIGAAGLIVILLLAAFFLESSSERFPVVVVGTFCLTLAGLGCLIGLRHARNPIGWLMLGSAFFITLVLFSVAYGRYAVAHLGVLARPDLVASIALWAGIPGFGLLIFVFLTFPTGRLLSPRWRWVAWLGGTAIVMGVLALMLRPGPIPNVTQLDNPLGVASLERAASIAEHAGGNLLTIVALAAIVSLFLRLRRSRGLERQQMKWFVFSVAMFPVFFGLSAAVSVVDHSENQVAGFLINMLGLLLIPLSMGVGILRHRLYDIDVVINRTLVYGTLSGISAGVYLGLVVLLQRLLEPLTSDSDLAIAASTLAVAALFRPLRSRLQTFIDRRFYRQKYDAAKTLTAFSVRLRDQVDLDSLKNELVGVIGATMQPAHASVWLRGEVPS